MSKLVDDFKQNKIWIHITNCQQPLLQKLDEMLGHIPFCSGDSILSNTMNHALQEGEAWFRKDPRGICYTRTNPRNADWFRISPFVYKYGEIIELTDFLDDKYMTIDEEDILNVIK